MSASVIWLLLGAAFMLTELVSPLCVMLFFGLGCWAAALAASLDAGFGPSLAVFSVVSVGSLLGLRRSLMHVFAGRRRETDPEEASDAARPFPYRDKTGQVTRTVGSDAPGEISLGGSFWRAVPAQAGEAPLEPGTWVRVVGHAAGDELLLRVSPLHPAGEPEREKA